MSSSEARRASTDEATGPAAFGGSSVLVRNWRSNSARKRTPLRRHPSPSPKLLKLAALLSVLKKEKRYCKKTVFTNGCFDILHVGHVRYLRAAKSLGDVLVVGLNSDASVRRLKGPRRPLTPERERAEVLSALSAVDHVVFFSEATPLRLIRAIRPDFLVKGGDWRKKDIVGGTFVESYGGKVVSLPFVKGFSTTSFIEKIKRS